MKCWDCKYWDEDLETCKRSECVDEETVQDKEEARWWHEFDEGMGR